MTLGVAKNFESNEDILEKIKNKKDQLKNIQNEMKYIADRINSCRMIISSYKRKCDFNDTANSHVLKK